MKELLQKAADAYYNGKPIMTDEEFDRLAEVYDFDEVGHTVTDGIPHLYQMYSLQKYFDLNDAPGNAGYIRTLKLDGAAISILYVNGELSLALTRGDGKLGRDITEKVRYLVPNDINLPGVVQITGEVVCPKTVENSRNVASGSLNLKDMEEFAKRPLTFVAYDIQGMEFSLWTEAMTILDAQGFNTVLDTDLDKFPDDGWVYRIDSYLKYRQAGFTAHHPRGAYALKEQKAGVITQLLDVTWQVGKSGVVSPVALLEPVYVGDALVSRATLHNIEYIRDLDLELGCDVEIIRSGEIIPRVVRRVD